MTIKWTEKDAIKALHELTNPFEQAGMQSANQKPKLSDVITAMAGKSNGEVETPVI